MVRISPVLLAVALSACGGGGNSALSQTSAPAADSTASKTCTSPGPVRIQLFGDSTQWEQGNAVQEWMDEWYGAGVVKVANLGVSGTTAADFPFNQVEPGAITVVNYGINDSRLTTPSVASYQERLRRINATVYETPNPPFDSYAAAMRDVAAQRGSSLVDVSARVRAQPGWSRQVTDGVHPTAFLYTWITRQVVGPALARLVDARLCTANAQQLGMVGGSSIRVSANSANVLWAVPGQPTRGQVTFENQGRASAELSFGGLELPYTVLPTSCTAQPNGGTCTVTVSLQAQATLGSVGTQVLVATGGDNGPVKAVIWGNVTEP